MLESNLLQLLIFPLGVLYLMLHAGPLVRIVYRPSIRGGTRWQFFGSEVFVFTLWMLFAPAVWHSPIGKLALGAHLTMHVAFTLADYLAHDWLLKSALVPWKSSPLMWFAKEFGLLVDTATHATVVTVAATAIGLETALMLSIPSLVVFCLVTMWYLRHFAQPEAAELAYAAGDA